MFMVRLPRVNDSLVVIGIWIPHRESGPRAGETAIRVESPGYACPTWAVVGGKPSLVVGQFRQGKMRVYPHLGDLKFGEGKWLEADGKTAEVPGVW